MATVRNMTFHDQTAWFSESVTGKRKLQWKKMGGKEESFDNAQFIFSENADCADTQKIFESEAYREEHLAVFHARYITDCWKASSKEKIPLGKYFLPPTRIQKLVRKQMKYIWDSIDSGVSSDEESDPNQDHQKTPLKNNNKDNMQKDPPQSRANSSQKTERKLSASPCQKTGQSDQLSSQAKKPELTFVRLGKSPSKRGAKELTVQTDTTQDIPTEAGCSGLGMQGKDTQTSSTLTNCITVHNKSGNVLQKQGRSSSKSTDTPEKLNTRHSPRISTNSSPTEGKRCKTADESYSLRKKKTINYSELGNLDLNDIVLDNTETVNRQPTTESRKSNFDQNADYFSIEDLTKVTSKMDDMVPGKNGFEVSMK